MMDYPVLAGCRLTRSDAAKVLPPVLLVCQRGCKWSANPLQVGSLCGCVWSYPEENLASQGVIFGSRGWLKNAGRSLWAPSASQMRW